MPRLQWPITKFLLFSQNSDNLSALFNGADGGMSCESLENASNNYSTNKERVFVLLPSIVWSFVIIMSFIRLFATWYLPLFPEANGISLSIFEIPMSFAFYFSSVQCNYAGLVCGMRVISTTSQWELMNRIWKQRKWNDKTENICLQSKI